MTLRYSGAENTFWLSASGINEMHLKRGCESNEPSTKLEKVLKLLQGAVPYPLNNAHYVYWKDGKPSAIIQFYVCWDEAKLQIYIADSSVPKELLNLSAKKFWKLREKKLLTPVSDEAAGGSGEKYLVQVSNRVRPLYAQALVWRGERWKNKFFIFAYDGSQKMKVVLPEEHQVLREKGESMNIRWPGPRSTGRPMFL